jgi:dTDP-4-dehydrorhamnose 3,5-epimerase
VKFIELDLPGAYMIELEPIEDSRGFFARSYCAREFAEHGLNPSLVQCNISYNNKRGTVRGMHFQRPPHAEAKVVRCTSGAIHDVIIDLRPDSPGYCKWAAVELSAANRRMLYIPEGFAHGFQSLTDDTEVFYQMSEFYEPGNGRGVRWNDPAFSISWPIGDVIISERDQAYEDFTP